MTNELQAQEPPKSTSCPVCEGKGYIGLFLYCNACWGTGRGNLDKSKADKRKLDREWSDRVNRLAAQDRPWER